MEEQWSDHAECRDAPDPNRFVEATTAKEQRQLIARYCSICPVSDFCFETAMGTPEAADSGIWGGTTEHQRQLLRRRGKYASKRDA